MDQFVEQFNFRRNFCKNIVSDIAKETGISFSETSQILRTALIGTDKGPPIDVILMLFLFRGHAHDFISKCKMG